jgi:hypothetical protein
MNGQSIVDGLAPPLDGASAEAAATPGAAMSADSDARTPATDDAPASDDNPDAGAPPSTDPRERLPEVLAC